MRRAPIVLSATVAGMAGVLAFQPHEPTIATASSSASPSTDSTATDSSTSSDSATSSSTGSGTDSSAESSSSTSSTAAKTYTGDAIATQYGNAQVKVTIAGGKITEVEALQLQGNDPKSVQISGSAAPLLRESALTKQTAAIDAVSGATITSASYEASLQSALDKAGFKAADGSVGTSEIPQVEEHHGPDGGFN